MSSVEAVYAPGPSHANVKGEVPPLIVALTAPFAAPPQVAGTMVPLIANAAAGCVTITVRVLEQPLASVTVQVHVPAVRPVALATVCTGAVFQE